MQTTKMPTKSPAKKPKLNFSRIKAQAANSHSMYTQQNLHNRSTKGFSSKNASHNQSQASTNNNVALASTQNIYSPQKVSHNFNLKNVKPLVPIDQSGATPGLGSLYTQPHTLGDQSPGIGPGGVVGPDVGPGVGAGPVGLHLRAPSTSRQSSLPVEFYNMVPSVPTGNSSKFVQKLSQGSFLTSIQAKAVQAINTHNNGTMDHLSNLNNLNNSNNNKSNIISNMNSHVMHPSMVNGKLTIPDSLMDTVPNIIHAYEKQCDHVAKKLNTIRDNALPELILNCKKIDSKSKEDMDKIKLQTNRAKKSIEEDYVASIKEVDKEFLKKIKLFKESAMNEWENEKVKMEKDFNESQISPPDNFEKGHKILKENFINQLSTFSNNCNNDASRCIIASTCPGTSAIGQVTRRGGPTHGPSGLGNTDHRSRSLSRSPSGVQKGSNNTDLSRASLSNNLVQSGNNNTSSSLTLGFIQSTHSGTSSGQPLSTFNNDFNLPSIKNDIDGRYLDGREVVGPVGYNDGSVTSTTYSSPNKRSKMEMDSNLKGSENNFDQDFYSEYLQRGPRKLRNREKLPPNAYTGEMINDSHQLDSAGDLLGGSLLSETVSPLFKCDPLIEAQKSVLGKNYTKSYANYYAISNKTTQSLSTYLSTPFSTTSSQTKKSESKNQNLHNGKNSLNLGFPSHGESLLNSRVNFKVSEEELEEDLAILSTLKCRTTPEEDYAAFSSTERTAKLAARKNFNDLVHF